jgi:hypothetical protein
MKDIEDIDEKHGKKRRIKASKVGSILGEFWHHEGSEDGNLNRRINTISPPNLSHQTRWR